MRKDPLGVDHSYETFNHLVRAFSDGKYYNFWQWWGRDSDKILPADQITKGKQPKHHEDTGWEVAEEKQAVAREFKGQYEKHSTMLSKPGCWIFGQKTQKVSSHHKSSL